ncbi:Hpt domain-containing protein [Psychrosphaera ytuae]|uniref:Hpt domain-containing protein n=1 Tax=Psychrosphaera ytuae TaxID=2820710 RepID=A0A975HIF5_9GAMM|nr:Hpt domain-containing protein [Psychrosphaera ytuae]QTH64185.1 Hpt domain-containing protein [Psychrosphaera ytuae]
MTELFSEDVVNENYEGLPEVMLIDGLESYCKEAEVYINEMRYEDMETLVRHAHSLKTMSKMVGAMQMALICEEFEKNNGQGKVKKEHIIQHWPKVKIAIETYVASLKY